MCMSTAAAAMAQSLRRCILIWVSQVLKKTYMSHSLVALAMAADQNSFTKDPSCPSSQTG